MFEWHKVEGWPAVAKHIDWEWVGPKMLARQIMKRLKKDGFLVDSVRFTVAGELWLQVSKGGPARYRKPVTVRIGDESKPGSTDVDFAKGRDKDECLIDGTWAPLSDVAYAVRVVRDPVQVALREYESAIEQANWDEETQAAMEAEWDSELR